jgi:lysozyme
MTRKKTNPLSARSLLSLLILASIAVIAWYLYKSHQPKFIRYPEFGIDIPTNYSIHGIDVSKYQNRIDWDEVRAMNVDDVTIGFTFIKATEGLGNVDPLFVRNWKQAKQAGIARGAYHFFYATKSGSAQASNFINTVTLEDGDLPPVLDVEGIYGVSPDKLRKEVTAFLDATELVYGVKPIIYTNVDFYNQYFKGYFDNYPLWVAHYLQKDRPRITRNWLFWQHSEAGHVNGIFTRVDFNVFNGDNDAFTKLLINHNQ